MRKILSLMLSTLGVASLGIAFTLATPATAAAQVTRSCIEQQGSDDTECAAGNKFCTSAGETCQYRMNETTCGCDPA